MSFWDRIKPADREATALEYQPSEDQQSLTLSWDDGTLARITAQHLRQQCPCAACVDEWTSKRTLDPGKVPADLKLLQLAPVGNYALAFVFSDQHNTGIYPWRLLRALSGSPG